MPDEIEVTRVLGQPNLDADDFTNAIKEMVETSTAGACWEMPYRLRCVDDESKTQHRKFMIILLDNPMPEDIQQVDALLAGMIERQRQVGGATG